jgi:hypothetical protein
MKGRLREKKEGKRSENIKYQKSRGNLMLATVANQITVIREERGFGWPARRDYLCTK